MLYKEGKEGKEDKEGKEGKESNQDKIFSFNYIQILDNENNQQKIKQKTKKKKEKNYIKSNSLNEILISERIKLIPNWEKYTTPILYSSMILGLNKYLLVKEDMDFSLLSFLKDKREKREENIDLQKIKDKETFIQIICIYNSLLKVIEWTEEHGLVSLSYNLNNIFFDKDNINLVKIGDFSCSFFNDAINLEHKFIGNIMPLGLNVLNYIKESELKSLSLNNICEICSQFVNELTQLDLFSSDFLQKYEKICISSLHLFINMKKERIIIELLKGSSYWDHFSMSIMFLIILKIINNSHAEFIEILLNNIMYSIKNNELTFC